VRSQILSGPPLAADFASRFAHLSRPIGLPDGFGSLAWQPDSTQQVDFRVAIRSPHPNQAFWMTREGRDIEFAHVSASPIGIGLSKCVGGVSMAGCTLLLYGNHV
jgi:hypothetical protein